MNCLICGKDGDHKHFDCDCCGDVGHHHVTGRHLDPKTWIVKCTGIFTPCFNCFARISKSTDHKGDTDASLGS